MNNQWYLVDNEMGLFVRASREAKGYSMEEISHGICSIPTLSRIEAGERVVDYIIIEALLERMKVEKSEYEFVLDEDDYQEYFSREKIKKLIRDGNWKEAEQKLLLYEKSCRKHMLHMQFIMLQRALIEQSKQEMKNKEITNLFESALNITIQKYRNILEQRAILSDTELVCIIGIIECMEDNRMKEERYREFYEYYYWCKKREKFYPVSYRSFMRKYAECLFNNENYERCRMICNEVLEELYTTSKLEDRQLIFLLRAKAQEQMGFLSEEEKKQCLRDYLTAYYVTKFFNGEESIGKLKNYIEEEYGWQFIE